MRHADRATSIAGADLNPVTKALISASVHNKQIRDYQDESEGSHTVSSLRYASVDKRRPDRRHYTEFTDQYEDIDIKKYLKILGFDDENETLQFQLDSWQRISDSFDTARSEEVDQGVILSADTGFGKTAAFSGEVFHQIASDKTEPTDAIFVYPSRALLRDQLGTALKRAVTIGQLNGYTQPSLGVWSSDIPFKRYQVLNPDKNDITTSRRAPDGSGHEVRIINHWNDSLEDKRLYVGEADTDEYLPYYNKDDTDYRIFTAGGETELTSEDLVLHKNGYRHITKNNDRPQILFTTLESLENIAFKPHYRIATDADLFVFDEIHQYTGVRGSHAARIINNVQWVREEAEDSQSGVFVGASATVAEPQTFGQELFGIDDESNITTVSPTPADIDSDNDDKQHYYFMLTPDGDEQPGVASQFIQQALLTGQSFLKDAEDDSKSKLLSFIDSTSQVNRLTQQTIDAQTKNLPEKHTNIDDGDWEEAAAMAGREFEDFKEPVGVYSGSDTSLAEIQEADVVNSTSFLEIGIDIGDLEFIGQYRSPRSLTNFKQRAGRGGRDKGTDAHIQVFLSAHAGDENFYYRADRFLEGDIHTPLNADNDVVNWIHDRFRAVYRAISSVYDEYEQEWHKGKHESKVIRNLFVEELRYNRFWKYLDDPGSIINGFTDIGEIPPGKLYKDRDRVNHIRTLLENKKRDAVADLREKSKLIVDSSADGADEVPNAATKKIRELRDLLQQFVDTAEELASTVDTDVSEELSKARNALNEITTESFETQLEQLSTSNNILGKLRFALRSSLSDANRSELYTINQLEEVEDAVEFLKTGELEAERRHIDTLNHLIRSLNGVEDYLKVREYGAAHGSLFAFKGLLRCAYFLNKAYQLQENEFECEVRLGEAYRDDPSAEFWFVPDDYFENAGKYFTLTEAQTNKANESIVSQEPVDSLLSKYVPFKAEYLDRGQVQAYCPAVTVTETGEKQLQLSEETTFEHKGVETPEELSLTEIEDLSDEEADEIYPLHPTTYKPLSKDEVEDLQQLPQCGKIMSRPDVQTTVEHKTDDPAYDVGKLWAGPVDGKAQLRGVEMSVVPYKGYRSRNFTYDDDTDIPDQYYKADSEFGFVLETTGLTWDLNDFLDELFKGDETHPAVTGAHRYKSFENVTEKEAALATAAHFLTLTVADVTGAGTQLLLYGIDKENNRVHVFDQAQGGQGIIELFYQEMERNPKAALDAVHRLIDNSQVLNDLIWAHGGDVEGETPWERALSDINVSALEKEVESDARKAEIAQLKQITRDTLGIDYDNSLNRVSEELASTIQRLHHFAEESNQSPRQFYKLKHALARHRRQGASSEKIPSEVIEEFSDIFNDDSVEQDTIKSLLYPPDMDGCRANLHLDTSIINSADQSEFLSYSFLRVLANHVVDRINLSDREKITERGRHWGRVIDDELEYLSWGDDL